MGPDKSIGGSLWYLLMRGIFHGNIISGDIARMYVTGIVWSLLGYLARHGPASTLTTQQV